MAHNVTHALDGDTLVIRIKLDDATIKAAPPSSSGKTRLVASSGGYQTVGYKATSYSISVTTKG